MQACISGGWKFTKDTKVMESRDKRKAYSVRAFIEIESCFVLKYKGWSRVRERKKKEKVIKAKELTSDSSGILKFKYLYEKIT